MALTISVSFASLHLTVDKQELASLSPTAGSSTTLLSFVDLKNTLSFVRLVATDIRLDPDSKNLYFVGDNVNALNISITDVPALSVSKSRADSFSIAEESILSFTSAQSDTVGITESLSKEVSFVRAFADSSNLVDSPAISFSTTDSDVLSLGDLPTLEIQPAKSDALSFLDSEVLSVDPAKSETVSVSDDPALSVDLPQSDGTTISESDIKEFIKAVPGGGTVTYTVTVASGTNSYGSGNKYYIDGSVSPDLTLDVGKTYIFDISDSSVSGHPLRFSETANGTHGGGTVYSTNVTVSGTAGSSGAYVEIQVTSSTPASLHYYCTNHSGMGGGISSSNPESVSISESLARVVTYSRSFADAYALDDIASPSDDLRTDFGINKNNIVSIAESLNYAISTSRTDTASLTDSPSIEFVTSFSDSITLSEVLTSGAGSIYTDSTSLSDEEVISFSKALSDTASVTESINVVLISGSSSVLNTSAFNTSVLN